MPTIAQITERISNRLINVKAKYRRLEALHDRLDIHAGINLEAKHPVERFCAKAILGWSPTKHSFIAEVSEDIKKTEFSVDQDEHMPIATSWFRDIVLLTQRLKAEDISANTVRMMDRLVHQIAVKLTQVEKALNLIRSSNKAARETFSKLQLVMWNDVCLAVKDGSTIPKAIEEEVARFRQQKVSRSQGSTPTGHGRCFEFAVEIDEAVLPPSPMKPYVPNSLQIDDEVKTTKPIEEVIATSFKVGPSPAYAAAFSEYTEKWKQLKPYEAGWPYPVGGMTASALHDLSRIRLPPSILSRLSTAQKMSLKVKAFLLAGNGVAVTFTVPKGDRLELTLGADTTEAQMKALQKYLKHKELARWHSDWINKRTGVAGSGPDESIGDCEEVKMVRTAVDELVEICGEWRKFLPKQGLGDSVWAD